MMPIHISLLIFTIFYTIFFRKSKIKFLNFLLLILLIYLRYILILYMIISNNKDNYLHFINIYVSQYSNHQIIIIYNLQS